MNDNGLVELYFARSEDAIELTLGRYGAYMRTIAFNITGNAEDADECVNDTVLRLWNTIPPQKPQSLKGYLGAIVRNASLDRYRSSHTEKRSAPAVTLVLDELAECIPGGEKVDDAVESMEISRAISAFLHSVSAKKRYVFVKRYYYSEPVCKIAESLKTSESNVKTMLFRMRRDLKSALEKEGITI